MARQNWFERVAAMLAVLSIGLVVSGTKACQEDYDLGSQANLNETPTAAPTDDGGDGGDDDTITPTPFGTVDPDPEPTETPVPEPTATLSMSGALSGASSGSAGSEVLQELQNLSEKDTVSGSSAASPRAAKSSNWLGDNFGKDNGENQDPYTDSDGDGFTDKFEGDAGFDPNDPSSVPPAPPRNLMARLKGIDSDADGLGDNEDPNPSNPDTDGDGRPDGAEVLSGGNARDQGDTYADDDGDGLSNGFEENRGSDSQNKDTDGDGLNDAEEQVFGSNATNPDTDADGILDGAEVHLFESDPTRGAGLKKK